MKEDKIIRNKIVPLLVKKQILSQRDVDKVVRDAENQKRPLLSVLLGGAYVEEKVLSDLLHTELGVTIVDPLEQEIPADVIGLLDSGTAKKYECIPFRCEDDITHLALSNPFDILALDDLKIVLGRRLKIFFAYPGKIEDALKKYYEEHIVDEGAGDQIEDIIKEVESEEIEIIDNKGRMDIGSLVQAADETPVIKLTNFLLSEGIKRRASDVFIEPWEKRMTVRCRVDGLLEELKAPPKSMANSIVSRLKVMSNLDIAERRMPQDGRFKIKYHDRFVDMRISVLPASYGEKVCLRILDKKSQAQELEKLGFRKDELEKIKTAAARPHGMILVTGPTGSGKTTTLYSVLGYLDSPEKNITTVEDPVEYQLFGINQVNVREPVGLTFPASLRSILRQDPDIIMIGEIRDFTTMDIAIKAALTGHLVLSTLHTNDASGSIVRITNMGIEPFLIASSVIMISAQRLIRRLCPECKESYEPSKKILSDLHLDNSKKYVFYQPAGCEACRKTGYLGRTVITEVLYVTQNVREMIMKKATGDEIKQSARQEGMTTLRESGIQKVIEGVSTVDEVFRITTADRPLT